MPKIAPSSPCKANKVNPHVSIVLHSEKALCLLCMYHICLFFRYALQLSGIIFHPSTKAALEKLMLW